MILEIKISTRLEDLVLVARLVDRLADLSIDPEAEHLRRDIKARLKRIAEVDVIKAPPLIGGPILRDTVARIHGAPATRPPATTDAESTT